MGAKDELDGAIDDIVGQPWSVREGEVVPKTNDVVLKNGAVRLDAVMLYSDLFDSTSLATTFPHAVAAKVVRAFLATMSRLVRGCGGEIRSFDGDRVMGVFVGDSKNSDVAKCGLQMNYAVKKMLRPKLEAKYPSLRENGFELMHCVGVARGKLLVVRAGVRGSNDLVFVGKAPNLAAKLSDIRNPPWHTYMTSEVYGKLNEKSKLGGKDKQNMWASAKRDVGGETIQVYKSSWWWTP